MTGGFRNDPALKALALADLEKQIHPGWSITATSEEREALAEAYGLSPGFIALVISPHTAEPREVFAHRALSVVAPGADLDAVVRDWMLSVWSHPDDGLAAKLEGSTGFDAAAAIIALIRANATSPVSRQTWREARNAMIGVQGLNPVQAGYATVVTCMAWDPAKSPTLAGDVWMAWERACMRELGLEHGWSQEREDTLMETVRACLRRAAETPGAVMGGEGVGGERFETAFQTCLAEVGAAEDYEAFLALAEVMRPFFMARSPRALETVFEACKRARA